MVKQKYVLVFFWLWVSVAALHCKKVGNPQPMPAPLPEDTTTLKGVAPFPVGAAIDVKLLGDNPFYREILQRQHSSITTENTLKWPTVHPAANRFDFTGGDFIAAFCAANAKRMHGHTLVWYMDNPDWLRNFSGDSLAWEGLLKNHIQSVVGHYQGKATGWDVVNEAFNDQDGGLRVYDKTPGDNNDDGSIWARHLGRDYIARAFQYAHEADPGAKLFYNDYGQEWNDRKTDSIIAMVNDFKARGIPIDGLGIQMHTDVDARRQGISQALQRLSATGLLVHISELDIRVNPRNIAGVIFSSKLAQEQADFCEFIVRQYKEMVPAAQRYGITTWNVTDGDSWIRTYIKAMDWPLLYDDKYIPKPAFYSFRKALAN